MTLFSKSKNLKKLLRNPQKKFKLAGTVYYLLHHPVIRTEKSTSRVRIVYDACAKREGPSLNDCLETGRTHYLKSLIFCCVSDYIR